MRRAIAYGIDRTGDREQAQRRVETSVPAAARAPRLLTQSPDYQPGVEGLPVPTGGSRDGFSSRLDARHGGRRHLRLRRRSPLAAPRHGCPGESSIRPGIVGQIQAQLRRVGVEVVPTFALPNVVFGPGGILARGEFDAAVTALIRASQGAHTRSFFGCGGVQNFSGYCQRLVTSDLDQAGRRFDTRRQAAALLRADRRLAQDVPLVPLFQHPTYAVLGPDVRGFALNSTTGVAGAVNWWLED